MWKLFKRLILGLGLIGTASAILLLSDLGSRKAAGRPDHPLPRVALFQYSTYSSMEEYIEGVIDGLAAKGFVNGKTMKLERFNAEGDMNTANLIAKQITDGSYTLIITGNTGCLQVVARANMVSRANPRTPHVFGIVIDPYKTGVGLNRDKPLEKPSYLTGMGMFQPIEDIFRFAKRLNPQLKTVGVVFNPAESNSEGCVKRARAICAELGMTLVEAPIEKASDVKEAAASLAVRGAEAFWTGGDSTVGTAVNALTAVARDNGIPFFSSTFGYSRNPGGVFDYGASFNAIGEAIGELSAKILNGADPAQIPVVNYVPAATLLNYQGLKNLKDKNWRFDSDAISHANIVIDENGAERKIR
jgi:putative tryptophan/tyrosine transport system substrate-binding protein